MILPSRIELSTNHKTAILIYPNTSNIGSSVVDTVSIDKFPTFTNILLKPTYTLARTFIKLQYGVKYIYISFVSYISGKVYLARYIKLTENVYKRVD